MTSTAHTSIYFGLIPLSNDITADTLVNFSQVHFPFLVVLGQELLVLGFNVGVLIYSEITISRVHNTLLQRMIYMLFYIFILFKLIAQCFGYKV